MSARRSLLVMFVIAMFASIPAKANAQILPSETADSGLGGSNIIMGTVFVSNGGRIERRVTIRLRTMTRGDRVTTTDENGNFAFRGLVSGDYTVVIDREKDFEPISQAVSIIQVRGFPPVSQTLSIRLVPKVNTQPKPGLLDAAFASLPEAGQALLRKARDLSTAGDHAGAIDQLLLLTSQYPTFMLGFNELGVEYLKSGQLEKADAALEQAINLQPDGFVPKLNRGLVLVTMKRYSDAEPILRAAKALNDQSGPVKYFLGTALANLGKFDEAEKELSAALPMGGNEMVEGHRILAIIYSSKGEKKRAAAELETYLKINPSALDAEQLKKVLAQLTGSTTLSPASKP
jgi:tetratricopeptide (TPR) repeat protein